MRRAYLQLSLACHPNKNPNNPMYAKSQFIRVGEAYYVLKDPTSPSAYDRELAAGRFRERNNRSRRPESSHRQHNNRQAHQDNAGSPPDTWSPFTFMMMAVSYLIRAAGWFRESVNRSRRPESSYRQHNSHQAPATWSPFKFMMIGHVRISY